MADAIIVVSGERGARRPMICKPFGAAARRGFISLDRLQNTRFWGKPSMPAWLSADKVRKLRAFSAFTTPTRGTRRQV